MSSQQIQSRLLESKTMSGNGIKNWWASLSIERKSLILVGVATLMCIDLNNLLYSTLYGITMISIAYIMLLTKGGKWIRERPWISYIIYSFLIVMIATPAIAQGITDNANACTNNGLLSELTNFIDNLFSTVTFGGIGGGKLSNLMCQMVGYVIVGLILAFIAAFGFVAFQVGFQQQPLAVVTMPILAFLIFSGGSAMAIGVLIGSAKDSGGS